MTKEVFVPTEQQENHLKAVRRSVLTMEVVKGMQVSYGKKDVALQSEYGEILFPPVEFQINGGVDELLKMIAGGVVGLFNELARPVNEKGDVAEDEQMKTIFWETVGTAKSDSLK